MSFRPVTTRNSQTSNYGEINNALRQLNKEQTVKTFKQPGGNAIVTGKLPYSGGYGALYYDSNGVPAVIVGIAPDGTTGIFIAKEGENVIDAFS